MFELAGLSTFLDVFQRAFGLIEKRKDHKRKLFADVVEPVYSELSIVVGSYYKFFGSCRDEFSNAETSTWKTVLDRKRKQREEIILARNKVLGIADSFLPKQYDAATKSNRKEDGLLYDFAHEIELFFFASDDLGETRATSLFMFIENILEPQSIPGTDITLRMEDSVRRKTVIDHIERTLRAMEWHWHDISEAYGDLRVHCLT